MWLLLRWVGCDARCFRRSSMEPCHYLGIPLKNHINSNLYWCDLAAELHEEAFKWSNSDTLIFDKASICNKFLFAKICYVMQIIQCTRANVQKSHHVFALFIWRSGSEPMCRDHLFRSIRSGGLGLMPLYLSQLVSRFVFMRPGTPISSDHPPD